MWPSGWALQPARSVSFGAAVSSVCSARSNNWASSDELRRRDTRMTLPDVQLDKLDKLTGQLAQLNTSRSRVSFLRRHHELWQPAVVEHLYARVVRLAWNDLQRADRLAQAAKWLG